MGNYRNLTLVSDTVEEEKQNVLVEIPGRPKDFTIACDDDKLRRQGSMSVKAYCSNLNSLENHVSCRDAYPVKWRGQSTYSIKYLQGQVYTADLKKQKPN